MKLLRNEKKQKNTGDKVWIPIVSQACVSARPPCFACVLNLFVLNLTGKSFLNALIGKQEKKICCNLAGGP